MKVTGMEYIAGKIFPDMKKAAAYRRIIYAVIFGGYLLAAIFAGMWVYERWIS